MKASTPHVPMLKSRSQRGSRYSTNIVRLQLMVDKYGVGQDPYCYPGSVVLRNLLNIRNEEQLQKRNENSQKSPSVNSAYSPRPATSAFSNTFIMSLFCDVYEWAGQLRSVNIQKGDTLFCTAERIAPEAEKIFRVMESAAWFAGTLKAELVAKVAETYGDLTSFTLFERATVELSGSCLNRSSSMQGSRLIGGWSKTLHGYSRILMR